ncbi:chorismate-binding protein [Fluviispira sanaruensis]|uniref:Aminodeoxychorismate/anthranilate synthase component I n=1 Tax=Fluviispira sanaruensis TaxID=2493639 RepID=A0A4V0P248_FLUSA|nr:chorismate-binding protein [Fluviispira sanaruensis]BBH51977.1 aminodeoxychorismate/anthranilate synthase component I [Fluviispira sanaruensis]
MTNNLKISYENKSSIENLDYFSQYISSLSSILEEYFNHNIACHFQLLSCNGYEFNINQNFIATNSIPDKYYNIYSDENDTVNLRFFCNTQKHSYRENLNEFYVHLKENPESPLFFVTPYENSKKEEDSYVLHAKFEIKIHITHREMSLSILNHSEEFDIINELWEKIEHISNQNHSFIPQTKHLRANNNIALKEDLLKKDIVDVIEKAKNFMNKGDCYLANLTSTKELTNSSPFKSIPNFLLAWLKIKSRYGIYYADENVGLACFSPERFIYSKQRVITTEPIKGTLKSQAESPTYEDALTIWADKKEIYEHTLVVDLMRNDLNLVCKAGSVEVYRPFYARKAGQLVQMQSSVLGILKENENLGSCLEKMLPAGSISGTPKKRVCEIITKLENITRGYYTGVCGVLEKNGDFDSTILIRSVYKGKRGVYCGVGAGITTLSNAVNEYEEFLIKLNSFLHSIESSL